MSAKLSLNVLHESVPLLMFSLSSCGTTSLPHRTASGRALAAPTRRAPPSTSGAGNTAGGAGNVAGGAGGSSSNEGPPDVSGIGGVAGTAAGLDGGPT